MILISSGSEVLITVIIPAATIPLKRKYTFEINIMKKMTCATYKGDHSESQIEKEKTDDITRKAISNFLTVCKVIVRVYNISWFFGDFDLENLMAVKRGGGRNRPCHEIFCVDLSHHIDSTKYLIYPQSLLPNKHHDNIPY